MVKSIIEVNKMLDIANNDAKIMISIVNNGYEWKSISS